MAVQTAPLQADQDIYASFVTEYREKTAGLKSKLSLLSFLRFLVFIAFVYLVYRSMRTGSTIIILSAITSFIIFFLLIKWYDKLEAKTLFYKALLTLNEQETVFLQTGISSYDSGKLYENHDHPFSYDLDIFGERGLYSYLNRCASPFGKERLATDLLHPDTKSIVPRQEAIIELRDNIQFRQQLQAFGSMYNSKPKEWSELQSWITSAVLFQNKILYAALMIFPLGLFTALGVYIFTGAEKAFNLTYILFVINPLISFAFGKKIAAHLSVSTSVNKLLQQYSAQLKLIEEQSFQSPLLQELQQELKTKGELASRSIGRLASLFNYLETVVNLVVSILLNGLFLFHVHVLFALERWKKNKAHSINGWLSVIGKMEALNSFANLAYNNPDFCRPVVSETETLEASELGHLLINKTKRVTNSVSFAEQKFVILTGSNMSGKSAFLRTLGTNLVLARAGSMVCANSFTFYPFDVYVSMRITDSLQDSESFFYAELKRLHTIMQHLQQGHRTFILLDEILRGTNSNDKRNGTIGLIRKLIAMKACGIVATHDVIVADLIKEYPAYIRNNCFESEIANDELLFDYKLKYGVCSKLSASFLMKKLGVID